MHLSVPVVDGKLGHHHQRHWAAKAPCQSILLLLWWGGEEWLDHSVLKAAVMLQKHTISVHFMFPQQMGRAVFVRRLLASMTSEKGMNSHKEKRDCVYLGFVNSR